MTSRSPTPCSRAASTAMSKMRSNSLRIRAPDFDLAEAGGARAVARAHHLLGLALAAVGDSPERPVFPPGDGSAGVPELGRDAGVARVLQHADAASAFDLPPDLAPELEVVPLVVDRPAAVGLHVDPVGVEDLVERLLAGQQADVGHADQRNAAPAVRTHAAVRAAIPDHRGRLTGRHVAAELPVADDVDRLRRDALVVEGERAEPRAVLRAGVADHVDDVRPVP